MSGSSVCVHFDDTGCEWRRKAFWWTCDYWQGLRMPVSIGTAPGEFVNRAAARNDAARQTDASVLFFADADMWVPETQMRQALELAEETDRLVIAYVRHMRLSKWSTQRVYRQNMTLQGQTLSDQPAGAIAISRRLFDAVGGHDERFAGWGGEDRAFYFACEVLGGPVLRIPGFSFHLWHPRPPELSRTTDQRRQNMALAVRYKKASGITSRTGVLRRTNDARADPVAMRELLQEQGGPLYRAVDSSRV